MVATHQTKDVVSYVRNAGSCYQVEDVDRESTPVRVVKRNDKILVVDCSRNVSFLLCPHVFGKGERTEGSKPPVSGALIEAFG